MNRSTVTFRAARADDAAFLAELWAGGLRRAEHEEHVEDMRLVIDRAGASPEQRLVIAEYDGERAGAVLLKLSTITPINLEPCLQVLSPTVAAPFRRHGIGRALMEAAVSFAEELGVAHVGTAVTSSARESNRFMARLALGPHATLRLAPTAAVRARLAARRPALSTTASGAGGRQVTRVLAARRSMRRQQTI